MRRRLGRGLGVLTILGPLVLGAAEHRAAGQQREVILLPPPTGATPASAEIQAQAAYLMGLGSLAESAAIARKIHAEAAKVEIENQSLAVKEFYERKRLWEEEWRRRHPTPIERQQALDKLWEEILRHPGLEEKWGRNSVDDLNQLLARLTGTTVLAQYRLGGEEAFNVKLTDRDKEQIWLNDGGRGRKIRFCLARPEPLGARWPTGLMAPPFERARKKFEDARTAVLQEIQETSSKVSYERGCELLRAVDGLLVALEEEYPDDRRKSFQEWQDYREMKAYLGTLLQESARTIKTRDRALFDGTIGFQGNTVVDLIQYMYTNGLRFSPPEAGGEGVYGKLFSAMRDLYLVLKEQKGGIAGATDKAPAPSK